MEDLVLKIVAFIVAVGLLVAVHEFGNVLAGVRLTPTTARCGNQRRNCAIIWHARWSKVLGGIYSPRAR